MMNIITITGQPLEEFFNSKLPTSLKANFTNKLEILSSFGRECIGAFVFPHDDIYYFRLENVRLTEKADVYISFIDVQNVIIIIDAVLVNK